MGKWCSEEVSADDISQISDNFVKVERISGWFESAALIICALSFFICYRKMKKPTFVILMWCLFMISEVANIVTDVLLRVQTEAYATGDQDKSDRIVPYFNELTNIQSSTFMTGHWIFAIKYAEVVLKLPLLVFRVEAEDIKAKFDRISCLVRILNGFFAAVVLTETLLLQLLIFKVWRGDM